MPNLIVTDDGSIRAALTTWLIDVGPFFDRFGSSKMPVLMSVDATVQAIVKDVSARKYVDLQRADVSAAIDVIISKAVTGVTPALKAAILTTPVAPNENSALRKLYYT